jgi:plasmid stability protein
MHYDVAMPALQIRNLPDDVYHALRARAQREGRSLSQQALMELRRLPELEARERRQVVLARLRARKAPENFAHLPDPVDLIREDRDA